MLNLVILAKQHVTKFNQNWGILLLKSFSHYIFLYFCHQITLKVKVHERNVQECLCEGRQGLPLMVESVSLPHSFANTVTRSCIDRSSILPIFLNKFYR